MGIFEKLFGQGPEVTKDKEVPKEVPKRPEREKSLEEKTRDLEKSLEQAQEERDKALDLIIELKKKELQDGPFTAVVTKMIEAHSAAKTRLREAENLLKEALKRSPIPSRWIEESA